MIKHICMDLGNTIINNIDFNLQLGLKIVYNQSIHKKLELDTFIHIKSYEELELEIYQNCVKDTIIDDAFDFLLFAKRHGLKVYIYSNSTFSKRALMRTIDLFQLTDLIDELYSSSDVGFRKPSAEFFLKTDVSNHIKKQESIFIGNDDYYDRLFAKAIGIEFGWYNRDKKEDKNQDVVLNFSNYQTLKEFILNYDN